MTVPRVSVGLPVFNGEEFLREAVGDLLAQTLTDFELIISDNASTDGTAEICRSLREQDSRIRYYREEENRGACWNHNRVVELARGQYFKFAAHDDRHGPEFLEKCVAVLDANPDVVWCHCLFAHVDPAGRRLEAPNAGDVGFARASVDPRWTLPTRESPQAHERFRAVLLSPGGNNDVFGVVRTDAIRCAAPLIPHYGMDKVLVAEWSLMGSYREVPQLLFFNRMHPEGSGALATAEEQQRFIDPSRVTSLAFTRFHLLAGHVRSVARSGLPWGEKARCALVLVEYVFQVRKWVSVLRRTLAGSGTGGAYVEPLKRAEAPPERPAEASPHDRDSTH